MKTWLERPAFFCAVDGYQFRIGNLTFEAIEDESDGYRSSLSEVRIMDKNIRPTFREEVTICIEQGDYENFYLKNSLNQVVLRVGTDSYDSYYPCFVFEFDPRKLSTYVDVDALLNNVDENI